MNSRQVNFRGWLHPILFAAWSGFLVYLLASNRYVAFLRPEFGLLLAVALIIAMGFTATAMSRWKSAEMDASAVLRLLVLLVPILYFVAMPDKMLGNQTFKKRFIGIQTETMGRETQSGPLSRGAKDNPEPFLIPEKDDGPTKKQKEDTIIRIYRNMDAYKGKRVIVTGMILRDEQLKSHLGGIDTAVYRFLINCCAADALPLPIALDLKDSKTFNKDQWVQVDGTFEVREINGKPVPVISKPLIKPIKEPAVPYMF